MQTPRRRHADAMQTPCRRHAGAMQTPCRRAVPAGHTHTRARTHKHTHTHVRREAFGASPHGPAMPFDAHPRRLPRYPCALCPARAARVSGRTLVLYMPPLETTTRRLSGVASSDGLASSARRYLRPRARARARWLIGDATPYGTTHAAAHAATLRAARRRRAPRSEERVRLSTLA